MRSRDQAHEFVEQRLAIDRARGGLGMELHAHERLRAVAHAFVRAVVGVREPGLPALWERCRIDGEAVVLRGDEAARGAFLETGLVVAAVAELELVGARARGKREQLVPEADAHDRLYQLESLFQVEDRRTASGRI